MKVALKELPPIQFIVPIERQLIESPEVARVEILAEFKTMIRQLLGDNHATGEYYAGMVMIAPMHAGSFEIRDIARFLGIDRRRVEKYVANLIRFRVWVDRCWHCEWGELFTGRDLNTWDDEEFQHAVISFVLDAMVASGKIARETRKDGFHYAAL